MIVSNTLQNLEISHGINSINLEIKDIGLVLCYTKKEKKNWTWDMRRKKRQNPHVGTTHKQSSKLQRYRRWELER